MSRVHRIVAAIKGCVARRDGDDHSSADQSRPPMTIPVEAMDPSGNATEAMNKVTAALFGRESSGMRTSLRQLHKVADLSQPDALVALKRLQRAGTVTIEHDLNDAFASQVELTAQTRRSIAEAAKRQRNAGRDMRSD